MSNLSNHPNYIKKQIPNTVNKRLSKLSKNKAGYELVKENYQEALRKGNYKEKLTYLEGEINNNNNKTKRKRRRNIIYFQPPFSLEVKTKIGKKVSKLGKEALHS